MLNIESLFNPFTRALFVSLSLIIFTPTAFAIDLYVDTKTQQIYAGPGENRVILGTFEKKEDIAVLKKTIRAEVGAEMNAKAQSTTLSMPAKPLIISNTLLLTDQSTVNQLLINC